MIRIIEEIWKDIDGYEGLYKISNLGRVKSLGRMRGCIYTGDKFLNQHDNGQGYMVYDLYNKKGRKKMYSHRLVAMAFLDNPNKYKFVNHKDRNTKNNNVSNLEWCTSSYNNTYKDAHLKRGEYLSKIWKEKVHPNSIKIICTTTGKTFNSTKEAVRYYNIENVRSHINSWCNGNKKFNYLGKLEDGTKLRWMYYHNWIDLSEEEKHKEINYFN